jgi:hypothetical protein
MSSAVSLSKSISFLWNTPFGSISIKDVTWFLDNICAMTRNYRYNVHEIRK